MFTVHIKIYLVFQHYKEVSTIIFNKRYMSSCCQQSFSQHFSGHESKHHHLNHIVSILWDSPTVAANIGLAYGPNLKLPPGT